MSDLSQLDQIQESDILEALSSEQSSESEVSLKNPEEELTNIPEELLDPVEQIPKEEPLDNENTPSIEQEDTLAKEVSISSSELNSLTSVLAELLNNKTLEITIKVKE